MNMKFNIPSYSNMVRIFILIGPLLWLIPYMMIVPYAANHGYTFGNSFFDISKLKQITNPFFTMFAGGMLWWLFIYIPSFWLITWIPTTLAALVYRYILNIAYPKMPIFESRLIFASCSAILSAVVSGSVFAATSFIASKLIQTNSPTPASVWMAQIGVVSIVVFCLGLIVGLIPIFTPKSNRDSK